MIHDPRARAAFEPITKRIVSVAVSAWIVGGPCAPHAWAQAAGGPPDTSTATQRKLNPLAFAVEVPATLTVGFGGGSQDLPASTHELQPRIPLPLNDDWRVITRPDIALFHLSGPSEPTGLGDLTIETFLTPAHAAPWVWGVGPIAQLPTATKTTFGTGKWSAGPTAALLYVAGPWVNGIVVSHLWSVAGPSGRDEISETDFEAQVSYAFADTWYVQSAPTLSYDWRAPAGERWVVPIGVDVGREFKIAAQDMSVQVGSYYRVRRASGGPSWTVAVELSWVH